jgi:hypothetical protein
MSGLKKLITAAGSILAVLGIAFGGIHYLVAGVHGVILVEPVAQCATRSCDGEIVAPGGAHHSLILAAEETLDPKTTGTIRLSRAGVVTTWRFVLEECPEANWLNEKGLPMGYIVGGFGKDGSEELARHGETYTLQVQSDRPLPPKCSLWLGWTSR